MAIQQQNPFKEISQVYDGKTVTDSISTTGSVTTSKKQFTGVQQYAVENRTATKIGGSSFNVWQYECGAKFNLSSSTTSQASIYSASYCQNQNPSSCIGRIDMLHIQFADATVTSVVPITLTYTNLAGQEQILDVDINPSHTNGGYVDVKVDATFDPTQSVLISAGHASTNKMVVSAKCTVSSIA